MKQGIYLVTISNIKKISPSLNHLSQYCEGEGGAIAYNKLKNSWYLTLDDTPDPNFVFFEPMKVCSSSI
jgi:hypothetical protein